MRRLLKLLWKLKRENRILKRCVTQYSDNGFRLAKKCLTELDNNK